MDDLIIGASGADPEGRTDAGETYVLFGTPPPSSPTPTPTPIPGVTQWGLVVLALLMAAVLLLRRLRRARAAER